MKNPRVHSFPIILGFFLAALFCVLAGHPLRAEARSMEAERRSDACGESVLYTASPHQPSIFIGRHSETRDRILRVYSPYQCFCPERWRPGAIIVTPEIEWSTPLPRDVQ